MMTRDDFDTILRTALTDAAQATHPDPDLADRLAHVAGPARAHSRRWATPMLAAAAVAALVIGIAAVTHVLSAGPDAKTPPAHRTTPSPHVSAPAVPGFHAANLYFADADRGWALGDAACPSGGRATCPALLATADGGDSWHPLTVPKGLVSTFDFGSCGTNGDVHGPCVDSVAFANASDGYLWSLHQLYWTSDGGRRWQHFVDPGHPWSGASRLVFVGDRVVRLAPVAPCSSGCSASVQSAPLGTTRFRVTAPGSTPVGLFSSNLVAAHGAAYLFGGQTYADTSPGIFRTTDGEHWTLIARNVCGRPDSPQMDPFDGRDSVVADDGALLVRCLTSRPLRIAAPGTSRFSAPRRIPNGEATGYTAARSQRQLVVAHTSVPAGASGPAETTFYVSGDGGRHWRRTATLPASGTGIGFVPGGHGWALSQDGTTRYVTADGGVTWRPARFPS